MRERTTWNREEIAKRASDVRFAEDPRAMNQDHLSQQPADDAYVIGGPSEFAEDVTPPNWKDEMDRNEIGMPEMLPESLKTAGLDMETLTKKAEVCLRLASAVLPGADEDTVEKQANSFMFLPDEELIRSVERLSRFAQDAPEKDDEKDDEKETKEAKKAEEKDEESDAKDEESDAKAEEKDEESDAKAEEKKASYAKRAAEALQAGDMKGFQETVREMVAYQLAEQSQVQQAMQQAPQACGGLTAEQVEQIVQQAMQQQMGQQQQQLPQQQAMQQQLSDDQLLDQMLQDEGDVQMDAPQMDIQLEGAPMDVGEVELGEEDQDLAQLFASSPEVQQAAQAQALEQGYAPPAAPPLKTASTRTVGTRPTRGVSQIGGAVTASESGGGDVDQLSGLWRSAPDVSGTFNPGY